MTAIAHISDIHFGAIDLAAAEEILKAIEANGADAVIVTGDLTQAGRRREYTQAADYLSRFKIPALVVPGNHDAPVYSAGERMVDPWRRFRKHINANVNPVLNVHGTHIVGLNSARRAGISLDWSRGRLSKQQITFATDEVKRAETEALRIVAFHHPVTPGGGVAGNALINAPARAIAEFANAGADMILTGHVHQAKAELYLHSPRPIVIAAAGTASSTRTRGEAPSFNLIKLDGDILDVEIWRYQPNRYAVENVRRFERKNGRWTGDEAALQQ